MTRNVVKISIFLKLRLKSTSRYDACFSTEFGEVNFKN